MIPLSPLRPRGVSDRIADRIALSVPGLYEREERFERHFAETRPVALVRKGLRPSGA